jgi:hypothetical protein
MAVQQGEGIERLISSLLFLWVGYRFSNPHHFNADPDPAFHFNADSDPPPNQSDANLRPLAYLQSPILSQQASILSVHDPPWLHFEP